MALFKETAGGGKSVGCRHPLLNPSAKFLEEAQRVHHAHAPPDFWRELLDE